MLSSSRPGQDFFQLWTHNRWLLYSNPLFSIATWPLCVLRWPFDDLEVTAWFLTISQSIQQRSSSHLKTEMGWGGDWNISNIAGSQCSYSLIWPLARSQTLALNLEIWHLHRKEAYNRIATNWVFTTEGLINYNKHDIQFQCLLEELVGDDFILSVVFLINVPFFPYFANSRKKPETECIPCSYPIVSGIFTMQVTIDRHIQHQIFEQLDSTARRESPLMSLLWGLNPCSHRSGSYLLTRPPPPPSTSFFSSNNMS